MDPLNFTVAGQSSLLPKSMGGGSRSLSLSRQSSVPGGGAGSRAGTIGTFREFPFKGFNSPFWK